LYRKPYIYRTEVPVVAQLVHSFAEADAVIHCPRKWRTTTWIIFVVYFAFGLFDTRFRTSHFIRPRRTAVADGGVVVAALAAFLWSLTACIVTGRCHHKFTYLLRPTIDSQIDGTVNSLHWLWNGACIRLSTWCTKQHFYGCCC